MASSTENFGWNEKKNKYALFLKLKQQIDIKPRGEITYEFNEGK